MVNSPKKSTALPPFESLKSYKNSDQYFVRVAQWRWLDTNNISVTDPHSSRTLTLDHWPQLVFLAASGNMTVREYVDFVTNLYSAAVPDNLDATIIGEIETLLKYGIIKMSATATHPEVLFDKAS